MKNLLYIGHTYHLKTRSSDFLHDLLKEDFDVTYFYINPDDPASNSDYSSIEGKTYDVLLLWQLIPDLNELKKHASWNHGVFFPMYDDYHVGGGFNNKAWMQLQDFLIICFCKKLYDDVIGNGYDARYIQYFPTPTDVKDWGVEHSVFFWQRITSLNLSTVAHALEDFTIRNLHLHKALDPGHKHTPVSTSDKKTQDFFSSIEMTESTWFDKKSDMHAKIYESAIYIAPRHYEGIGMSFLEAMAAGRCVVAPNNPTMNEYIENGKTGLLYDWDNSTDSMCKEKIAIPQTTIREIQKNCIEYISNGHRNWLKDRTKIIGWLTETTFPDRLKQYQCAIEHNWMDGTGLHETALEKRIKRSMKKSPIKRDLSLIRYGFKYLIKDLFS